MSEARKPILSPEQTGPSAPEQLLPRVNPQSLFVLKDLVVLAAPRIESGYQSSSHHGVNSAP